MDAWSRWEAACSLDGNIRGSKYELLVFMRQVGDNVVHIDLVIDRHDVSLMIVLATSMNLSYSTPPPPMVALVTSSQPSPGTSCCTTAASWARHLTCFPDTHPQWKHSARNVNWPMPGTGVASFSRLFFYFFHCSVYGSPKCIILSLQGVLNGYFMLFVQSSTNFGGKVDLLMIWLLMIYVQAAVQNRVEWTTGMYLSVVFDYKKLNV